MIYIIKSKETNVTVEQFENAEEAIEYLKQRTSSCYLEILKW